MKLDRNGRCSPEDFERLAEATRFRVQELVKEEAVLADPLGNLPAPEVAAAFWAQLSGVITAAANGLSGLGKLTRDRDRVDQLRAALHAQLDSAFEEAWNRP